MYGISSATHTWLTRLTHSCHFLPPLMVYAVKVAEQLVRWLPLCRFQQSLPVLQHFIHRRPSTSIHLCL